MTSGQNAARAEQAEGGGAVKGRADDLRGVRVHCEARARRLESWGGRRRIEESKLGRRGRGRAATARTEMGSSRREGKIKVGKEGWDGRDENPMPWAAGGGGGMEVWPRYLIGCRGLDAPAAGGAALPVLRCGLRATGAAVQACDVASTLNPEQRSTEGQQPAEPEPEPAPEQRYIQCT